MQVSTNINPKVKNIAKKIFDIDHYIIFIILLLYISSAGHVGIIGVFVAHLYTTVWYYVKRLIIAEPIKIVNVFLPLFIVPSILTILNVIFK